MRFVFSGEMSKKKRRTKPAPTNKDTGQLAGDPEGKDKPKKTPACLTCFIAKAKCDYDDDDTSRPCVRYVARVYTLTSHDVF